MFPRGDGTRWGRRKRITFKKFKVRVERGVDVNGPIDKEFPSRYNALVRMNSEFIAMVPDRVKWPGSSFSFLYCSLVERRETGESSANGKTVDNGGIVNVYVRYNRLAASGYAGDA